MSEPETVYRIACTWTPDEDGVYETTCPEWGGDGADARGAAMKPTEVYVVVSEKGLLAPIYGMAFQRKRLAEYCLNLPSWYRIVKVLVSEIQPSRRGRRSRR